MPIPAQSGWVGDPATGPSGLQSRFVQPMKPAGVLIPILERRSGLAVLLTRRSSDLKHHAGQVSFPGGSMEDGDRDIRHTALRETHEEVGINLRISTSPVACRQCQPSPVSR